MKLISAIIRPSTVEPLWSALAEVGVHGMTVSDVKGYGQHTGYTQIYRGNKYQVISLPKAKIEIVTLDDKVEMLVALIHRVCATGEVGDGKIFIMDLEQVIRVRTGEKGEYAL